MPQIMNYEAKSIIYFEGDNSEKIYILQTGEVYLVNIDIETGEENKEFVKKGEFFGVKSVLGKYQREETVRVLSDSVVLVFESKEFETLIYKNPRILLQMLKVFSNQLRRVHKQVRSLLSIEEQIDAELGLFNIGEYYLKNQKKQYALYAFRKYLTYYPEGMYQENATKFLIQIENKANAKPDPDEDSKRAIPSAPKSNQDIGSKSYFDGVNFFTQEKYEDAINSFKQYIEINQEGEFTLKAFCEIGKIFFILKKYDECLRHFTTLAKKYPKSPDIPEFLLYLGLAFEKKNDIVKATGFFNKVISITEEGTDISRKAKKALKNLENKT